MASIDHLPSCIVQFLSAVNGLDSEKLVSAFDAINPILVDEAKTYKTISAIKAWSDEALVGHNARVTFDKVTEHQDRPEQVTVEVTMDGDFAADYGITEAFTLYMHFELLPSLSNIHRLIIDDISPDEPTMRAVWASKGNVEDPLSEIRIATRRIPKVPQGWVRVKMAAVGLNYHDLFTLQGLSVHKLTFPLILGNEGCGVLDNGNKVVLFPLMTQSDSTSEDAATDETLDPTRHVLGEITQGSLAEYVVVPEANAVPLPDGLSETHAAVMGIAWLAAFRLLFTKSGLKSGQKMLVQGSSGGVATALIQLGRAAGMTVWSTGRSDEKRQLAMRLGAHKTFESGEPLPTKVDAVFVLDGKGSWQHSISSVKEGGTIAVCGRHSGNMVELDLQKLFVNQIRILGSYLGNRGEFERLLQFVTEHKIEPYVSSVLPLERADEGFQEMYEGKTQGKIVVTL
jgi:NADPH:quinone reductase-like Zn-dependent oxidoreductase/phage baseplate assembly protein W